MLLGLFDELRINLHFDDFLLEGWKLMTIFEDVYLTANARQIVSRVFDIAVKTIDVGGIINDE